MSASIRSSEQIREDFLKFFEAHGHTVVPSASIVPGNDPTLLFTNAGMNQFKDVFLGAGTRPYVRAADTQKCLRVSGKHNDLEEVGFDTYHHTFFEMLGNWSFGDYFKREAIRWAWELLVGRWGLDPGRLYVTFHEGDDRLGLAPDEEAAGFWRSETGIPPDHILPGISKDNFWMMGDTGPCGPCSEVHVDLRPDDERARTPGADLVNTGDPGVMEIWNLVFIQYNALPDGTLEPLAAQHVDTGMGFERMVAVLQGKRSNYDTDLFAPILQRIADLSPLPEVKGYDRIEGLSAEERERRRVAMRVIADHIRAIAFAVADGATPGNTGRGYVIRRILRRAVRFGYQALGLREPFLFRLVEPLREKMGRSFPELARQQDYVERVVRAEEESFLETLGTGIAFFERVLPLVRTLAARAENANATEQQDLALDRPTLDLLGKAYGNRSRAEILESFAEAAGARLVPGEVAFLLHDTYGFPFDLTGLMAREEGLGVDAERFDRLMQEQKSRARAASSFRIDQSRTDAWQTVSEGEDSHFVGYDALRVEDARVRAVQPLAPDAHAHATHRVVLDRTPFYAESGGQVGDVGVLRFGDEEVRVLDARREQHTIVHYVDRLPEALDAPVEAVVEEERRRRIMKHHTATHLLHAALREALGRHVQQKGSLVAPDRLRFDFSHFERVTPEQLREIEARVNEVVQRNVPKGEERRVPVDEALARGAMALFGEKYGDFVRVITFDPAYSVELCGGTHVEATGEIGLVRILSEGSVASGVRRLEAVTGRDALDFIRRELESLERVRGQFRALGRPVEEEVAALAAQLKTLEKELARMRQQELGAGLERFAREAQAIGPVRLAVGRVDGADMDALRDLASELLARLGPGGVAVLGAADVENGKAYLACAVSEDRVAAGLKAGQIVGALAKLVGGGGGGRPNLATAGGRRPEKLDEALREAARVVGG